MIAERIKARRSRSGAAVAAPAGDAAKAKVRSLSDGQDAILEKAEQPYYSDGDDDQDDFTLVVAVAGPSAASNSSSQMVLNDSHNSIINNNSGAPTLTAKVVDEEEERERYMRESVSLAVPASVVNESKRLLGLGLAIVAVAVLAATLGGVMAWKQQQAASSALRTDAPSMAPSLSPQARWETISSIIMGASSNETFVDGSPQAMALDWIVYNDSLRVAVDDKRHMLQRYALAVLYFSTAAGGGGDGADWTESLEFLSAEHECTWVGAITCDEEDGDAVTAIVIRDNELQGQLPNTLQLLTALQRLELNDNLLTGTIPLLPPALRHLELGGNQLNGTLWERNLQNLTSLETLDLGSNSLSGDLDSTLGQLSLLQVLKIQENRLSGTLPSALWALSHLRTLSMDRQIISGAIPETIGDWKNLTHFGAHNMNLTGTIPTSFGLLTSLTLLQLAANHLRGTLPSEVGHLTNLVRFSVSYNGINGTVPTQITQLHSLRDLYLQNTWLEGDVNFLCDAIDQGILGPLNKLRADLEEVQCRCCKCCNY